MSKNGKYIIIIGISNCKKNEDDSHSVLYICIYVFRTCGGGVQTEERQCGGTRPDLCVGASKRFSSCNLESCPRYTIIQLFKDARKVKEFSQNISGLVDSRTCSIHRTIYRNPLVSGFL